MPSTKRALTFSLGLLLAVLCGPVAFLATAAPDRYTIPGDVIFPEGIAVEASSGDFYVGSTTDGTIYRGNRERGEMEPFLPGGADGRTAALGMKVDGRGRLFVAGGGSRALFVYDLRSRALLARFDTESAPPAVVNDVALAPDGTAYFTDSSSPVLYRVTTGPGGELAFARWLDLRNSPVEYRPMGANLNGIAVTGDGRYLLAVQTNTGMLFRIEIATREIIPVSLGDNDLRGDGLLLEGTTLYGVAGGQIATVILAENFLSGRTESVLTDPAFASPTTLARLDDTLLVVNSQFARRTAGQSPVLPFTVAVVPAPPR